MSEEFGFAAAFLIVKQGRSIARRGWNGKDMFVRAQYPDENSKMTQPYLYITTPAGDRIPWLISQADVFAEDWFEVV